MNWLEFVLNSSRRRSSDLRFPDAVRLAIRSGAHRAAPYIASRIERVGLRWQESRFDARHGTETLSEWTSVLDGPGHLADGQNYEATTPGVLRQAVRRTVRDPARWTFLDAGCGKGKMLLLAAECGFGNVLGIEVVPSLAALARRNIAEYRRRNAVSTPIRCVEQDAAKATIPSGPLFVFMYNPFGAATMRAFAERLRQHADSELVVAYANPRHEKELLDTTGLARAGTVEPWLMHECHVYGRAAA
jgi:SAM-dependent methyltransferase